MNGKIKAVISSIEAFFGAVAFRCVSYGNVKNAVQSLPDGFTLTAHTGCEKTPDNSLEAIQTGYNAGADISGKYGNATVKANWAPTVYTITLDENGGNAVADTTYTTEGGVIPAAPVREGYTFSGWDKQAGVYVIKEDTIVTPKFDKAKHEFGEKFTTEATCTEPGSQVEACKCGYKKIIVSTIPALGHTDVINETTGEKVQHIIVAPTHKADGSDSYICQRCGVKVTKKIDKLPSETITIVVKDANGNLAKDGAAKVTITNKNNPNDVHFDFTDMDGKVVFTVAAGQEWTVAITGKTLPQGGYGFELGKGETSFEASPDMEVEDDDDIDCSCTCHKGTFWGIIFRLFQKFLALFRGGKIKCCSDPSELYK